MTELIGRIVRSRCGRDRGRDFVIVGIYDDEHVLIADGESRKTEKPKKKKLKHLCFSEKSVDLREMPSEKSGAASAYLRKQLAYAGCETPRATKEG